MRFQLNSVIIGKFVQTTVVAYLFFFDNKGFPQDFLENPFFFRKSFFSFLENSVSENFFSFSFLENPFKAFWIGLRRNTTTKEFYWINGLPFTRNDANFNSGDGKMNVNIDEDCVTLGVAGASNLTQVTNIFKWFDISCNRKRILPAYICQKNIAGN